ncbi:hypothetical protein HMPREF1317_1822 [Schaalia georgiae F0490]|uniref:Uncharacterized protein n=1 Tax=Schaalia georgiae F0490 TaxID=1125717 RepID=J0N043_9ACTO|nr:hypothetical protein HMPREF1317_1822 [Schaalia georgiae F0490]
MTDRWNQRPDPTPLEGGASIRLALSGAVAGGGGPDLEGLVRGYAPGRRAHPVRYWPH